MFSSGSYGWLFWLALLYFLDTGRSVIRFIHISQKNGNDTPNCWNGGSLVSNSSICCKSLDYALQQVIASNETVVDIVMMDSVYLTNNSIAVHINQERNHLNLRISSMDETFSMRCSNTSFGILNINGPHLSLELRHITFEMCGRSKTLPAIMINDTLMVSLFSCSFRDNWSSGLFAINSVIHMQNCTFENNLVDNKTCRDTSMCDILNAMGGAVGFLFKNENRNMSVNISESHFINNSVHVDNETYYVADKHLQGVSNRGGAVRITFGGNSILQSRVNIQQCQFEGNRATLGGALHIGIFEMSTNHIIEISNSTFLKNYGSQVGGAFITSLWDNSAKTSLSVTDVVVKENLSRSGSGIYLFLMNNVHNVSRKQTFLFRRVHIHNNQGPTGSAVKIASPVFGRQFIEVLPVFEDCSFKENFVVPFNKYGYMPSFLVDRVAITFNGTNVFQGNGYAGAVLFSNSLVHVHGKLNFIGNIGGTGGALMMEKSQIMIHPNTHILFLGNRASMFGGAIHVVSNPMYRVAVENNPECFITYSEENISPKNWNANVSFINNTAVLKGAAINIDSLVLCGWDVDSKKVNFKKSLKWSSNFFYKGNRVCPDIRCQNSNETDISTDVTMLVEEHGIKELKIAPGESGFLNITAKDELNHSIFTLTAISTELNASNIVATQWFDLREQFYIIKPNKSNEVGIQYSLKPKVPFPGNATSKVYLLDILSNPYVVLEIAIRHVDCHPGFILKGEKCVCDKNHNGVIGCTTDGLFVQYREGYWVGVVNGHFTVMPCPYRYCKCPENTDSEFGVCYFNPSKWNDTSLVCASHREGILCGECQQEYSAGFLSYQCVSNETNAKCTITSILSILLTIIVCILILYFNPGLDNVLRGPLFFFQVLPIFYPPVATNDTSIVYKLTFLLSSIVEFTIPFLGYFIPDCYLIDGVDNLSMLALSYSSSVLALLVFFVALMLSYKRIIHIRRKNAVQCFWLLLIFMYTSLTKTSLRILHCPSVQGELRLFAQGNVKCYQNTSHLVMSIFAILILTFCAIVIPLLIIMLTASSILKVDPHYIDTLTNDLKPLCLWWWAVELLRRLLVVVLDVVIPIWNHKQVSLIFASVLILSIHCFFQPYRQQIANVTEAIFLLVLCGIAVFQMLELSDEDRANMNLGILSVMLLYTSLVFIWKIIALVRERRIVKTLGVTEYENIDDNESTTMTRSTNYPSVEERREKINAMFSRSVSSSDLDD